MIDNEEVAAAVASAVGQARLDAGVNLTGLLIDLDRADSVDSRRYFMCWQLTRVLAPSLAEKVPPAVARKVAEDKQAAHPQIAPPDRESRPMGSSPAARPETESVPAQPPDRLQPVSRDIRTTVWWLSALLVANTGGSVSSRHAYLSRDSELMGADWRANSHFRTGPGYGRGPGHLRIDDGGLATAIADDSRLNLWRSSSPFRPLVAMP